MHPELSGQWLTKKYYPYGDVTEFTVKALMKYGDDVVWSCTIPSLQHVCGGFSGPYEALAYGLQLAEEIKRKGTTVEEVIADRRRGYRYE